MTHSGTRCDIQEELPAHIASPADPAVRYHRNYQTSIQKSEVFRATIRLWFWRCGGFAGPLFLSLLLFATRPGTAFGQSTSYPQIGSVWWGSTIYKASPSRAAQVQLYLAPNFTASQAAAVRASNSSAKILTTVNAMETTAGVPAVPDSYYLLDVNGNRIKNWPGNPGNFLLNLTNPAVVQFMAQYAAQNVTQGGFTYDGMFFDNVELRISTMTQDCCGNPIQINDNYPGPPDGPGALDAKWSAGMYSLISQFQQLMPNTLISVHANQAPPDSRALAAENGDAFVFDATNIREGTMAFGTLYDGYQQWFVQGGKAPVITAIQSSPPIRSPTVTDIRPLRRPFPRPLPSARPGIRICVSDSG